MAQSLKRQKIPTPPIPIGTMTGGAHPAAVREARRFARGEIGVSRAARLVNEALAIRLAGERLHAPVTLGGVITSGGSEANILAFWIMREIARRQLQGADNLEVIIPQTKHYSVRRACNMLDLTPVTVPVGPDHRVR